jgi:hypothetical protein
MPFFTFGNYKGTTNVLMWSSEPTRWKGTKPTERVGYVMNSRRAALWWTRGEGAVGQGLGAG